MIVLDASAALAFALPSQSNQTADAFFARRPLPLMIAPAVFRLEVNNALLKFERGGALKAEAATRVWDALRGMVAISAMADVEQRFDALMALARAERLSLFDAAYLDLAITEAAALASRDGPLLEAALRRGLAVEDLC